MKTKSLIWMSALTMVSGIAIAQDAFQLSRLFEVGKTDRYTVTNKTISTVDMSAMGAGEQETVIETSFNAAYTIASVKEKVANIDISYTDFKLAVKGEMAAQMGLSEDMFPKEAKASGKMDATGALSDYKLLDAKLKSSLTMMGGETALESFNWVRLPAGVLKEGTEFKLPVPKMPSFTGDKNTFDGRVIKVMDFDGKPAVQVVYGGTLPMEMDLAEMMKDNPNASEGIPKMTMSGNVKMSFTVVFEKSTGKVLKLESFSSGTQKINLVDMGISFPLSTEMSTIIISK